MKLSWNPDLKYSVVSIRGGATYFQIIDALQLRFDSPAAARLVSWISKKLTGTCDSPEIALNGWLWRLYANSYNLPI